MSDKDKVFTSHVWEEMFRLVASQLCYSSSYHPQSDGQTEVTNRGVEAYLRCFCSMQPTSWSKWLFVVCNLHLGVSGYAGLNIASIPISIGQLE